MIPFVKLQSASGHDFDATCKSWCGTVFITCLNHLTVNVAESAGRTRTPSKNPEAHAHIPLGYLLGSSIGCSTLGGLQNCRQAACCPHIPVLAQKWGPRMLS
ncbi:hypothetical protein COCSUDRAFT_34423 [Coccomyxa subellipsoidea C-169]|uniref:Uncharacterized protein n=1 Tax=Coccomyxa subellipsoidea (strain C-169) TaxID=574566 RepID=I0YKI9_COCSC|nr:hypothetical protein COCSUDRAFT_34423 [Coccomyxa subellipsoidea C-169]EIE18908.1 hypothetical protein COCSUDRAFT_34423 [Coccomyxa subellipsoidea C-169]|eukprot:XP_005643452.1 hypothetical protein COCSUDRAFT_34423 [Coccomyxa subellipsoidea C-169]